MPHYLVVANQTLGRALLDETVIARAHEGAAIHVTVPATPLNPDEPRAGDTAESVAQLRLNETLLRLEQAGVHATGNVGAADPLDAIREQLQHAHYSGMIISTLPRTISGWLHLDLPHKAVREFRLPVEWVESDDSSTVHIAVPNTSQPKVSNQDKIPALRTH